MWAKDIYKFGESVFNTFTDLIENMIAGLNTIVMMGEESVIDYSQYKISLLKTRNDFCALLIKIR